MMKYKKIINEARSDIELNKLTTDRNTFDSDNIIDILTNVAAKKDVVALKAGDELFFNLFDITPAKKPDPSGLPMLIKRTELDNTKVSFKTTKTELVKKLPVEGEINEYTNVAITDLINTIALITKGTFDKNNKREIFLKKLGTKTGPFFAPQLLVRVITHNGTETSLRLFKEERDVGSEVPVATITVDRVSLIALFQNGVLVKKHEVNTKGVASALNEPELETVKESSTYGEKVRQRLIKKVGNNKVYKDSFAGEYVVKYFRADGSYADEADYFTDDKEEALQNAEIVYKE